MKVFYLLILLGVVAQAVKIENPTIKPGLTEAEKKVDEQTLMLKPE